MSAQSTLQMPVAFFSHRKVPIGLPLDFITSAQSSGSWLKGMVPGKILYLSLDLKDKLVSCVQKPERASEKKKEKACEKAQRQDSAAEVSIREGEVG